MNNNIRLILSILIFLASFHLYGDDSKIGQIEYTIHLPSYEFENGKLSSARDMPITRLSSEEYMPNQIIIKTRTNNSIQGNKVNSTLLKNNFNQIGVESIINVITIKDKILEKSDDKFGLKRIKKLIYTRPIDVYEACKILMKNPDIEYACPVYLDKVAYEVNDPQVGKQWFVKKIELDKAWDITKGKKNVVISIVDSGIDWTHEDLLDNIWVNPGEIPNNGIDDDKNGFIDDVNGWDFVGNLDAQQISAGIIQPDNDTKPTATGGNTHGTHVSGCAASVNDNEIGVTGSSFNCSILPVKVGSDNFKSYRYLVKSWEGVQYSINMGVDIINCSWGGFGYSPLGQDIVNQAYDLDIAMVAAAGNNGINVDVRPFYPASYDNVLSVGSTTSNDRKSGFSNYGMKVDVYAPGSGIYATMPYNKYQNQSGTSMASPVTAGVVALLKSYKPGWDVDKLFTQLRTTCDPIVGTNEDNRPLYFGRINAYKALAYNTGATANELPGMFIKNIVFESKTGISELEKSEKFKLVLKNSLGLASKLSIKIIPQDYFLEVVEDSFYFPSFVGEAEKEIEIEVKLKNNTPWYKGTARIMVVYTSNDSKYKNYELLEVPIELETENKFSLEMAHDEHSGYVWYDSYSFDTDKFYFVGAANGLNGQPGAIVGHNLSVANAVKSGTSFLNPVTSINGTDSNLYISTSHYSNGTTNVYSLNSAGTNATFLANTSSITPFINKIHFFNDEEGIIVGDPKDGEWGVARTSDGGKTWNMSGLSKDPLEEEAFLVGCGSGYDKKFITGTNKGNILFTKTNGLFWKMSVIRENVSISSVFLSDDDKAMAIYRDVDGGTKFAYSTNAGASWNTNVENFIEEGIVPIQIWSPEMSSSFFVLFEGGQIYKTSNGGNTWEAVLSEKFSNYQKMVALQVGSTAKILQNNSEVLTKTEFMFTPENAVAKFEISSEEKEFIFDTVAINKISRGSLEFLATGNIEVSILEASIVEIDADKGDFTYFSNNKSAISLDNPTKLTILFQSETSGLKTASLNLKTNGSPSSLNFDLRAFAFDPNSINDEIIKDVLDGIEINPMPVKQSINLNFNLIKPSKTRIDLFDELGKLITTFKNDMLTPNNYNMTFDVSHLSPDIYIILIETEYGNISRKIIKK